MKQNFDLKLKNNLKSLRKNELFFFIKKVILNSSLNNLTKNNRNLLRCTLLFNSSLSVRLFKTKATFTHIVSQCSLTWRTRSVYSFFKLSRMCIRELAAFSFLKGLRKSSW